MDKNSYKYSVIDIRDIPNESCSLTGRYDTSTVTINVNVEKQELTIGGKTVHLGHQKTGYGSKRFFICPYCGKRRTDIYFSPDNTSFTCRSCINANVYSFRTNIDDRTGECLIYLKVFQILDMLKAPVQKGEMPRIFMYTLLGNLPKRPKYMREEKYALTIKKLYFLHWMWTECINGRQRYTATDIKDMLEENNVNFVYERLLFPEYHPNVYEGLKDDENYKI